MKCPGCQHVAVERNAKFCSECGLKLPQNSDQPPQKPSVPAEIGKDGSTSEVAEGTASHGTQSTNASAKRHKEGTKGNPKKKSQQASSGMSSSVDPVLSVEPEQMQQSSNPKEEPSMNKDCLGEETSSETKDQNVPPPPKGMTAANQQIEGSNKLTIYFHAVLSKDFKFDPNRDRIFLRAGSIIGNWEDNAVELTVSRNLGEHGFFVEGRLVTIKKEAASNSIPYKYVVYRGEKNKYKFEYIYKLDSKQTTNRCLFVKQHLLNEEGEWHQYDDIICVEPFRNILSGVLPDQKKNVFQGREIAGRIMLETIFDLLRCWSKMNLKSFLTQLSQFYQVYSNSYVYEDGPKKWSLLEYDEEHVNGLLKEFILEMVTLQREKDNTGRRSFIKDPLKAAVIVLYICKTYNIKLDSAELSRLCVALSLPDLPKDEFVAYWLDFSGTFSCIKNLSETVRGESAPFKPVSFADNPTYDSSWAGLRGLKSSGATFVHSQDRRAIINLMKSHSHLFMGRFCWFRSCFWVMTLEEFVECGSIVQAGLLDLLQAFYLKAPTDMTSGSTEHCTNARRAGIHFQLKGTLEVWCSEYRCTTEKSFSGLKSRLTFL
ncbi:hypothetical protein GJAV_G00274170 [Gymnothorax javanicus]|nr:hypothetical protein GJAV_G00274170 [Gymnothorax javanicus]